MSQIYYLGDGGQRGAYYFHAPGHRGWVVADLDTEKCQLLDKVVRIDVEEDGEARNVLERKGVALAQAGSRWLVTWSSALCLFRDHGDEIDKETVVVYEQNGSQSVGRRTAAVIEQVCGIARRAKKDFGL